MTNTFPIEFSGRSSGISGESDSGVVGSGSGGGGINYDIAFDILSNMSGANDFATRCVAKRSICIFLATDAAAFRLAHNADMGGPVTPVHFNSAINSIPDTTANWDGGRFRSHAGLDDT